MPSSSLDDACGSGDNRCGRRIYSRRPDDGWFARLDTASEGNSGERLIEGTL